MADEIVFVDVETPNRRNDRICAIGLLRCDMGGNVLGRFSTLIDPETAFDKRATEVNGIARDDVIGFPNFYDCWGDIGLYIDGKTPLVAHGAAFDLSAIDKTMQAYEIARFDTEYSCTLKLGRALMPGLESYGLKNMCGELGVNLISHHEALADAIACKNVFFSLNSTNHFLDNGWSWDLYRPIGIYATDLGHHHSSHATADVDELITILKKIVEDGTVDFNEVRYLHTWLMVHEEISSDSLYSEVQELVEYVLADGVLSESEGSMLLERFRYLAYPVINRDMSAIEYQEKAFCLSGDYDFGDKDSVGKIIEERGGLILKSVTKKCDYVVVGNQRSDRYAFGNYGSKVKKALEMQKSGSNIRVISESDLNL